MKLKKITLEGFRGFNERQTINLDADVVIIYGPNGTGKSSIAEALEWLFFDDIWRRKFSRCPIEYGGTHIKNVQYVADKPFVEVEFEIKGLLRTARKEYVSAKESIKYLNEEEVERLDLFGLPFVTASKPILSQAEIRRLVDTRREERWAEVARMLGLEEYGEAIQHLRNVKNEKAKDVFFAEILNRLSTLLIELEAHPEMSILCSELKKTEFGVAVVQEEISKLIAKTPKIQPNNADLLKTLRRTKDNLLRPSEQPRTVANLFPVPLEVTNEKISELNQTIVEVISKNNSRKPMRFNKKIFNFKEDGLHIYRSREKKDEICPFCEEKTLTEQKETSITEWVQEYKEQFELERELSDRLSSLRANCQSLIPKLENQMPNVTRLELAAKELSDNRKFSKEYSRLGEILKLLPHLKRGKAQIEAELRTIATDLQQAFDKRIKINVADTETKTQYLVEGLKKFCADCLSTDRAVQGIREDCRKKAPGLTESEQKEIDKLKALETLIVDLPNFCRLKRFQKTMSKMDNLIESLIEFEKGKVGEKLNFLSQDIKDLYEKLNPNEIITFDKVEVAGTRRKSISLVGSFDGKELNPVSCFSEAHTNSLGIALYLSQRVQRNPDWGFILLDDPVQSMDANHVTNLATLLLDFAETKQVLVFTHQADFCKQLCDLFYGKRLLRYEFFSFSKEGPGIQLDYGPFNGCLEFASGKKLGTRIERKSAANNVRCAMEDFCRRFLVEKQNISPGKVRKLTLGQLLSELERVNFDPNYLGKLRMIKSKCDKASHGDQYEIVDVSTGEIDSAIRILKEVDAKYLSKCAQ